MKKILLILVLPLLICGCTKTKQEMLSSNLKQCLIKYTEQNFDLAKQSCEKVLEIEKKGPAAEIADTILNIMQISDEKDFPNNLDKLERFPIIYLLAGGYAYDKKDYEKAKLFYRKANKYKYNLNEIDKLPLKKGDIKKVKQVFNKYYTEAQNKFEQFLNQSLNLCKLYVSLYEDECAFLSENGNEEATLMLAFMQSTYSIFSKSDEEVKELLQPLLDKSNKDAKCILGFRLSGTENKQISKQGIKLLEESIGQKCDINNVWIASGKSVLARAYYYGDIVNVDYKKALALFEELEKEEKVDDFFGGKKFRDELQILIGFMYFMGLGTPSDNKTAYEYWQKAYQIGYEYAAIPMIEYTDLNKYLDTMLHFKKEKDKKEYINWITNGEGKKYLIKKDTEERCLPKLKKYATAEGIYIYATRYNLNDDEDDYCGG